jgi:hypothetical protein
MLPRIEAKFAANEETKDARHPGCMDVLALSVLPSNRQMPTRTKLQGAAFLLLLQQPPARFVRMECWFSRWNACPGNTIPRDTGFTRTVDTVIHNPMWIPRCSMQDSITPNSKMSPFAWKLVKESPDSLCQQFVITQPDRTNKL